MHRIRQTPLVQMRSRQPKTCRLKLWQPWAISLEEFMEEIPMRALMLPQLSVEREVNNRARLHLAKGRLQRPPKRDKLRPQLAGSRTAALPALRALMVAHPT